MGAGRTGRLRAAAGALLVVVGASGIACGVDVSGERAGPDAADGGDAASALPPTTDADTQPNGADASSDGTTIDSGVDATISGVPTTCLHLHKLAPALGSAVYAVDPTGADGGGGSIMVRCDMTTAGGGWTLVGRELANGEGQFRYLSSDSNNPDAMAAGTQSGLLGSRFVGKYTEVWIDWASGSYIRFTKGAQVEMFAKAANTSLVITNVTTSDGNLAGWLSTGGGGRLCIASRESDIRPGDTSWAIKPQDDNKNDCGCNDPSWDARGAFYGGAPNNSTACGNWGGGWAGVRDNGAQKGGIKPAYETRIWIR